MPTGKTIALLIYPTISHVTATLGIARALREKENRIIYPVFEDLQEFIENHDFIFYRLNNYHFARNNEELSLTGGSIRVILNGLLRRMDMELFNSRKESLLRFYALHQPDYILIDSFLAVDFIMLYNCIGARTKICFLNTMLSTTVFSDKLSFVGVAQRKWAGHQQT